MSARYRPESENQCGECGRCGNRVGEESQSYIAPGKLVTHDAGAHDGRHEERGPEKFRRHAARE
jgi:hypothetical protein